MDAQNPAARRVLAEQAEQAELVGALRLPTGAHQRTAGTQVITDLLVLRRRDPDVDRSGADWEQSEPWTFPDAGAAAEPVRINRYFHDHPDRVLGEVVYEQGRFGTGEPRIIAGDDTAAALRAGLEVLVTEAGQRGQDYAPRELTEAERGQVRAARVGSGTERFVGHIADLGDGQFSTRDPDGSDVALSVPAAQAGQMVSLLGLRDRTVGLLTAEAATVEDTDTIEAQRSGLRTAYTGHVARFGPLNRVARRRTGRVDPDTVTPRSPPR